MYETGSCGNEMSESVSESRRERVPLDRERVLGGAIAVADAGGVGALTIRSLAAELGVKPMSVYYYFGNKGHILDGIVDVVSQRDRPPAG
jgi:AcrR family transcriptional regulator